MSTSPVNPYASPRSDPEEVERHPTAGRSGIQAFGHLHRLEHAYGQWRLFAPRAWVYPALFSFYLMWEYPGAPVYVFDLVAFATLFNLIAFGLLCLWHGFRAASGPLGQYTQRDLDAEVIRLSTDGKRPLRLRWPTFQCYLPTSNLLILQFFGGSCMVLARRMFETQEDFQAAKDLIAEHVPRSHRNLLLMVTESLGIRSRHYRAYKTLAMLPALYEAGVHDAVLSKTERYMQDLAPEFQAKAYCWRSQSLLAKDEFQRALEEINTAIEIDPAPEYFGNRARAYIGLQQFEPALDAVQEGIGRDSLEETPTLHLLAGAILYDLGRPDEAIEHLTREIAIDDEAPGAWQLRGTAYAAKQDYKQALANFDRALELGESAEIYANRAHARIVLRDMAAARGDCERALELEPKHALALALLGALQEEAGEDADAVRLFHAALQSDPNQPTALAALANMRYQTASKAGEYEQALEAANEVLKIIPNDVAALNNRAIVHGRLGNREAEIADWNRAIELDPNNAERYSDRGSCFMAMKQGAQALADYNHALQIDPKCALALRNRGALYSKAGKYRQALADFEAALALEPDSPVGLNNRAYSLAVGPDELRDPKQALADAQQAIKARPDQVEFQDTLGVAHAANGQYAEAVRYVKQALEQARDEDHAAQLRKQLACFEANQPYYPEPELTL